jgi:phosphonopyruvate decarboxylase
MIETAAFFDTLKAQGIDFFVGVPDSLLKDFCAYVADHTSAKDHVITANEGNAMAMAAGYYLGTGRPALVYLQNSGLGNTVNPLMSLNDPEVYGLPALLMVGWRGEPGVKDEPQHIKQGRITPAMLDVMEIPWHTLDADTPDPAAVVAKAMEQMRQTGGSVALLVHKAAFAPYELQQTATNPYPMVREQAIERVVQRLQPQDLVVATTGMAARELYEYRVKRGESAGSDFLTVGAMGHAASIALGLARTQAQRRVVCLDGDGAVLMHMGGLAVIGQSQQHNFLHVVLNNGAHDSVGGQATCALSIDIAAIARACGYAQVHVAETPEAIDAALADLLAKPGPCLLEIRVSKGARKDLGRPKSTPADNRNALMAQLGTGRAL